MRLLQGRMMKRALAISLLVAVLPALAACGAGGKDLAVLLAGSQQSEDQASGGGGASTDIRPEYQLKSVEDVSNQMNLSFSTVINKVSIQNPAITGAGCDGTGTEPVWFSMWVGDYAGLNLSAYTSDLERVAQMDQRQQLYFGRSTAYQTFVNNAYLINGDTALVAPKGTSVVWYEFYCSTGTLSAGRVDV